MAGRARAFAAAITVAALNIPGTRRVLSDDHTSAARGLRRPPLGPFFPGASTLWTAPATSRTATQVGFWPARRSCVTPARQPARPGCGAGSRALAGPAWPNTMRYTIEALARPARFVPHPHARVLLQTVCRLLLQHRRPAPQHAGGRLRYRVHRRPGVVGDGEAPPLRRCVRGAGNRGLSSQDQREGPRVHDGSAALFVTSQLRKLGCDIPW